MSQNGSLSNSSSKSSSNSSSSTVSNNALQQRDELHAAIWRIADDVRGAIVGLDFKQYVLCTLFYRFISEHFVSYIDPDGSYDYIHLNDDAIDAEAIDMAVRAKGYFIRPSHLF